jgi:hypothetical protein
MPAAVLLEQTALAHLYPGLAGHQVVGVLDCAPALGVGQPVVARAADAVELQQPVAKAIADGHLAGAHLAGGLVVGDDRLRAGAAR